MMNSPNEILVFYRQYKLAKIIISHCNRNKWLILLKILLSNEYTNYYVLKVLKYNTIFL